MSHGNFYSKNAINILKQKARKQGVIEELEKWIKAWNTGKAFGEFVPKQEKRLKELKSGVKEKW